MTQAATELEYRVELLNRYGGRLQPTSCAQEQQNVAGFS